MTDAQDKDFLRQFARDNSEAAFTELVRRHINLVYSVARRCTGNDDDARDVTQAVFIILRANRRACAKKRCSPAGFTKTHASPPRDCCGPMRAVTRANRSIYAIHFERNGNRKCLDATRAASGNRDGKINAADRTLLVLRFYENKTGAEAAALLGIREDAAHKRAARAIERLRKFFCDTRRNHFRRGDCRSSFGKFHSRCARRTDGVISATALQEQQLKLRQ